MRKKTILFCTSERGDSNRVGFSQVGGILKFKQHEEQPWATMKSLKVDGGWSNTFFKKNLKK